MEGEALLPKRWNMLFDTFIFLHDVVEFDTTQFFNILGLETLPQGSNSFLKRVARLRVSFERHHWLSGQGGTSVGTVDVLCSSQQP